MAVKLFFFCVCIGLIVSSCACFMPHLGLMGVLGLWHWYFWGHRLKSLETPDLTYYARSFE